MIDKAHFDHITNKAYEAVFQFCRATNEDPRILLGPSQPTAINVRSQQAQYFADVVVGAQVWPMAQRLGAGFISWLYRMDDDGPAIVIDPDELNNFYASRADHNVEVDVQMARGIIHEVGHIRLHPGLLDGVTRNNLVHSAEPRQENDAWIFASTVLGVALGDYSEHCKNTQNIDDAPSHPI